MSDVDADIPIWGQLILLLVLILLNGFFAMSEMAIVSTNKNRIKPLAEDGNKRADTLLRLLDEPNRFLSTIQILITFAGFLASAAAAVGMSDDLGTFLHNIGVPYSTDVAVIVVTILLCFVTLVLGELYPKRIAIIYSERISLSVARTIDFFSKINKPFVWVLSATVNAMLRLTGQYGKDTENRFSEDEVISMLEAGQESGAIKEEGRKMIDSIFAFDDVLAHEIMTPRTDVFLIDIEDPVDEYIDQLMELRYSRIPVCRGDSDNIIGIVHIKDYLIRAREAGFDNVDLSEILRKVYFIPETKNIDSLFFEMQKMKQQIAVLIDEYGGFSGIVTMEDIIEQVMGDIDDEYDDEEPEIVPIDDTTYMVDGNIDLDDLNEALDIELESESCETLGGYLIELLGEIPEEDDEKHIVEEGNMVFRIESVKDRRIEKVKLCLPAITPEPFEAVTESKRGDGEKKNDRDNNNKINNNNNNSGSKKDRNNNKN